MFVEKLNGQNLTLFSIPGVSDNAATSNIDLWPQNYSVCLCATTDSSAVEM